MASIMECKGVLNSRGAGVVIGGISTLPQVLVIGDEFSVEAKGSIELTDSRC